MITLSPAFQFLSRTMVLLTGLLAVLPAQGETSFSNLLEHSPFGGEGSAGTQADPAPALEFRGYVYSGQEINFSLLRKQSDGRYRSDWVAMDESCDGCVVRDFDPATEILTVDFQGHRILLSLAVGRMRAMITGPMRLAGSLPPNASTAMMAEEIGRSRGKKFNALFAADSQMPPANSVSEAGP